MNENRKERGQEELVKEFLSKGGEFKSFHAGMSAAEKKTFKGYLKELRKN
jgi:hypothetical protein